MAEVVKFAKSVETAPEPGSFVMTESAQDILRSLHLVSKVPSGAITLIAAAPGTGKTETLWHFKNSVRTDAVMHVAVAREDDTAWGAATQLMETLELGRPNNRNLRKSRQEIAEAIGVDGMLMVDEAQNLVYRNPRGGTDWSNLEWFRALAEEGCFSLVFSGDLALLDTAQRLPQLWRRMRRRVVIRTVSQRDVGAFTAAHGLDDTKLNNVLHQVARRGGGIGDIANAVDHARLMAGEHDLSIGHVMAALADLKLLPEGK